MQIYLYVYKCLDCNMLSANYLYCDPENYSLDFYKQLLDENAHLEYSCDFCFNLNQNNFKSIKFMTYQEGMRYILESNSL